MTPVALRRGLGYARPRRTSSSAIGVESEDHFETRLLRMVDVYGWCGYHPRNSEACRGVHTRHRSDHRCGWGFPDWTFIKPGQPPKFRELKTDVGNLTPDQKYWQRLLAAAGADVGVWRPRMWNQIIAELSTRR
jgi:hypothetical protein